MSAEPFVDFIADLSQHLRTVETRAFGRSHPQTVSLFGPELKWRAHMQMEHAIFRHPSLDFATIHIYEHGTIDDPRNTVDPAIGRDPAQHHKPAPHPHMRECSRSSIALDIVIFPEQTVCLTKQSSSR